MNAGEQQHLVLLDLQHRRVLGEELLSLVQGDGVEQSHHTLRQRVHVDVLVEHQTLRQRHDHAVTRELLLAVVVLPRSAEQEVLPREAQREQHRVAVQRRQRQHELVQRLVALLLVHERDHLVQELRGHDPALHRLQPLVQQRQQRRRVLLRVDRRIVALWMTGAIQRDEEEVIVQRGRVTRRTRRVEAEEGVGASQRARQVEQDIRHVVRRHAVYGSLAGATTYSPSGC